MQETIQEAEQQRDEVHDAVQPYMATLAQRVISNYALLFGAVVAFNVLVLNVLFALMPFIPQSTMGVLGFAGNLLILYYGWRFLEGRNSATALFVLYTQYSSQRRTLTAQLDAAETEALEDDAALIVGIEQLEASADDFLTAAEETQLQKAAR